MISAMPLLAWKKIGVDDDCRDKPQGSGKTKGPLASIGESALSFPGLAWCAPLLRIGNAIVISIHLATRR